MGYRSIRVTLIFLSATLMALVTNPVVFAQTPKRHTGLSDELIVKFKPNVGRQRKAAKGKALGQFKKFFEDSNWRRQRRRGVRLFDQLAVMKLSPGVSLAKARAALAKDPDVEFVEPNLPVSFLETIPNDPSFNSEQWPLKNTGQFFGSTAGADIKAPQAWDITTGSANVTVAVIDTGIDYNHPDLAANIWVNSQEIPGNGIDDDGNSFVDDVHGANFINLSGNPMDDHNHGTHVAGTIGAVGNNAIGVAGVSWNVRLMPIKILDSTGHGTVAGAIEGIQYAINQGAHILNNSWTAGYSQALRDVVYEAIDQGVVVVAAAGNDNSDVPMYPAAFEPVIAVAATTFSDTRASFSNYGSWVDVAAPGTSVYSTIIGGYGYFSGTSMATPHVAGLAALMRARNPSLLPYHIDQIIKAQATDLGPAGRDNEFGAGRINAYQTLLAVPAAGVVLPSAAITSPQEGRSVQGSIEIYGSTAASGFLNSTLEYQLPLSSTWTGISTASTPIQQGLLGTLVTNGAMSDGDLKFRLTVRNTSGASMVTVRTVNLDHYTGEIWVPAVVGPAPGFLEVSGTAKTNGIPFDHFTLEYGVGTSPTEWFGDHINAVQDGLFPVEAGPLGIFNYGTLPTGPYTLRLTTFSPSGSEAVFQSVYIDKTSPTLSILQPFAGQLVQSKSTVNLDVLAQDDQGILVVQFFLNGDLFGVSTEGPLYSLPWNTNGYPNGTYSLWARAYDYSGNYSDSALVQVQLRDNVTPGTPTLSLPGNNATLTHPRPTFSWGNVSHVSGISYQFQLSQVADFSTMTLAVADLATNTLTPTTNLIPASAYFWRVRAKTGEGSLGNWSVARTFKLNADVTFPTVSITSPAANASLTGVVSVNIQASDANGITQVALKVNGVQVGTTSTAPYKINWDTSLYGEGNHTLVATATDTAGNVTSTAARTVKVLHPDLTPPVISFSSPQAGATVSGTVNVTASASDNRGVKRVEFYVSGILSSTKTAAPFVYAWDTRTVPPGPRSLFARAYDAAGNATTSDPLTVTVKDITAPGAPTLVSPLAAAQLTSRRPGFDWNDQFDLSGLKFTFQLSRMSNFASFVVNESSLTASQFALASDLATGVYYWRVRAVDNVGNIGAWSVVRSFTIKDIVAPLLTVTNPTAGANVSGTIVVSGTASDADSGLASVKISVNGSLKVTLTASSYTWSWNTSSLAGTSPTLLVVATDKSGNTTSKTIVVHVGASLAQSG